MTNSSGTPLPKFDDPPVVESVLSVEFAPLERWGVPHYGLFWEAIRQDFPRWDVKPPLSSVIERFDKPSPDEQPPSVTLRPGPPDFRCWYIDEDDRTLIQIQNGRFIHNWRKTGPEDKYPHYDKSIRLAFEQNWKKFCDFTQQNDLGQPYVIQCEITYINHLEIRKGWESPADLPKVLLPWSGATNGHFLPAPDSVAFDVNFRLPDDKGRLRVSAKPAIRNSDGTEIVQLNLTARGKPDKDDPTSALEWLDLGRQWVVRGFADLTSSEMHKLWKRRT